MNNYVVAFDTANEMISLGIGLLDRAKKTIDCIASREVGAFRASNVKLLPEIDALLADAGISRGEVACVVCGRGPGSFTGVRICLASAKGIAIGLGVPLFGVSTSDAQAWQQWANGVRGSVVVLGDAMQRSLSRSLSRNRQRYRAPEFRYRYEGGVLARVAGKRKRSAHRG